MSIVCCNFIVIYYFLSNKNLTAPKLLNCTLCLTSVYYLITVIISFTGELALEKPGGA